MKRVRREQRRDGDTRTDLIAEAPIPERQNAKLDETEARSAQLWPGFVCSGRPADPIVILHGAA